MIETVREFLKGDRVYYGDCAKPEVCTWNEKEIYMPAAGEHPDELQGSQATKH